MNKKLFFLALFFFWVSCQEKVAVNEEQLLTENASLEQENQRLKESEEKAKALQESQLRLQEQLDQQAQEKELERLAQNEPVTVSEIRIYNVTKQGTVLSSDSAFKEDDVRYIKWEADYTDNVVKSGSKTYGTLYVKYIKKDDNYSNSWSILDHQGSFTEIDGSSNGYTRKFNMTDDGAEYGTWNGSLGSESGYDYDIGKWKIELYWDQNSVGKAIYLGGKYFEVY